MYIVYFLQLGWFMVELLSRCNCTTIDFAWNWTETLIAQIKFSDCLIWSGVKSLCSHLPTRDVNSTAAHLSHQ